MTSMLGGSASCLQLFGSMFCIPGIYNILHFLLETLVSPLQLHGQLYRGSVGGIWPCYTLPCLNTPQVVFFSITLFKNESLKTEFV